MKILKACVIIRSGYNDQIVLEIDLKSPLDDRCNLTVHFNALRKTGAEYVRNNFDITPEIIFVS